MSVQPHLFHPGRRYRVLSDMDMGPARFRAGEVVTFELDGYVPYDSSYAYQFRDGSGGVKTWLLHESAPVESWRSAFEPLD